MTVATIEVDLVSKNFKNLSEQVYFVGRRLRDELSAINTKDCRVHCKGIVGTIISYEVEKEGGRHELPDRSTYYVSSWRRRLPKRKILVYENN
jgi:hypothetical protein